MFTEPGGGFSSRARFQALMRIPEPVSWVRTDDYQPPDSCMDSSGIARASGEQWNQGPCVNCTCDEGTVSCHATMCKSCETPAPLEPDECCPRCVDTRNDTVATAPPCPSLADCEPPCKPISSEKSECPTCQCPKNKVRSQPRTFGTRSVISGDTDTCFSMPG